MGRKRREAAGVWRGGAAGGVATMKRSIYEPIDSKAARKCDSFMCVTTSLIGGIAFGIWQHSWTAGVFALFLLAALTNIGWVIEWGNQTEKGDPE